MPAGAYRGAARPNVSYIVERLVEEAAREMGITGVPFFIFNRQVGLSGAHEGETLLQGMVEAMNAATDD